MLNQKYLDELKTKETEFQEAAKIRKEKNIAMIYFEVEKRIEANDFNKRGIIKESFEVIFFPRNEVIEATRYLSLKYPNFKFKIKEKFFSDYYKIIVKKR